jgi:hypothetical protein
MNFNIHDSSYDGEYELFRSTTAELINLYGVPIKYLITEKVNQDNLFGEHMSLKVDNEAVHEMHALPSEFDNWGGDMNMFGKFGLQDMANIDIYLSRDDMETIHPDLTNREGSVSIENLPNGNLVIFGNNKIMEVTDFELSTADHGNNNVFTSDRHKNVYKLSLRSYIANRDDYREAQDITDSDKFEYEDFGNLSSVFGSEDEDGEEQSYHEEVTHRSTGKILEDEKIYDGSEVRKKPIRNKVLETNPFGDLG